MMNNMSKKTDKLACTNVVYEYQCNTGDCATRNVKYVGYTTNKLSRRLTCHVQQGGIKNHHMQEHGRRIKREDIVENTVIIARSNKLRRLQTLEAVFIREELPLINTQTNNISTIPIFDGPPISARSRSSNIVQPTVSPVSEYTNVVFTARRSERIRRSLASPPTYPDIPHSPTHPDSLTSV